MKTLHNFNTWATFVPLYLVVWGYVADTVSPDQCRINYFFIQHVELCHKPNLKTADQCKKGWGFVLDELVIAPLTEYDDCGTFHNNDLLDANCLREKIVNYDERVFEVLGKVSGQNKIDNGTTVERFEFSVAGSDAVGGVGGGPEEKDTSAFVSFRRNCRPADPDMREDIVVNMCANMTIEGFRVFLTLQGTADIPSQASFCRCVITPIAEMDVKALDVRLQNVKDDGQRCGPSVLKIESKESPDSGSRELKCEGKKALYGFHQLQKSSKDKEVVLTLTSVDSNHFPTAVWIEVEQEYDQDAAHTSMTVACEGFVPMSEQVVTDSESPDNSSDVAAVDQHTHIGTILGAGVGALAALTLIVALVFLLVRRYKSRLDRNTYAHIEESRDTTNTLLAAVPDRPDFRTCPRTLTEEADQNGHYRVSTSSADMELIENPPVYDQLAMQRNQHIYSVLHQH